MDRGRPGAQEPWSAVGEGFTEEDDKEKHDRA